MTRFDFCYKAALSNGILKRMYKIFPMKYDCTHLYSCYLFEIIAIFWREKSQNLLVLESSFQEQRSKHLFFGNLFSTDSSIKFLQELAELAHWGGLSEQKIKLYFSIIMVKRNKPFQNQISKAILRWAPLLAILLFYFA